MKKHIKLITFISSILLVSEFILAQPTVASVSQSNMATSVGQFTGTLNLSYPIAKVSNGSVSAGVEIGYVGTGYKPSNPSSEVGMDWFLSTGFSITRTFMGKPDGLGQTSYGDNYSQEGILNGNSDGELDLYNLTAFGQNIPFLVQNSTVFKLVKSEIKIEVLSLTSFFYEVSQFKVTNNDGTIVIFDKYEGERVYDHFENGSGFTQHRLKSWKPISLTSYDGNQIQFLYSDYSDYTFDSMGSDDVVGTTKYLNKIIGLNDTITLNYINREDIDYTDITKRPKRLSEIKYHSGSFCLSYEINSTYFSAGGNTINEQIKLNSIQKKSCDGTVMEPPIEFSYNTNSGLCDKSTTGLDHWGFSNYQTSNDADNMISSQFGGTANREIDTIAVNFGMLNSVKDINGKVTVFTYEPHRYQVNPATVTGATVNVCHLYNGSCNVPSNNYFFSTYVTNNVLNHAINVDANFETYNGTVTIDIYRGSLNSSIHKQISYNGSSSGSSYQSFLLQNILDSNNNPFFISGYVYYFKINVFRASATMTYTWLTSGQTLAGGLRLKSINEGGEITNYSYTNGMLYNEPNYYEKFTNKWVTVLPSSINLNYLSGSHIGYGEVSVSKPGLGKTVTKYKSTFTKEFVGGKRNVCDLLIQGVGNLECQTIYDNNNNEISRDETTYKVDTYNYSIASNRFFGKSSCNFFGANCTYYGLRYHYQQYLVRPHKKRTYNYGTLISTTTYEYTHSNTIQPSAVKTSQFSGQETMAFSNYTSDYWPDLNMKNYFINKNIIIPFQNFTSEDGFPTGDNRTEFTYFNSSGGWVGNGGYTVNTNIVRPRNLLKSNCDSQGNCSLEEVYQTYLSYTSDGLISTEQKINWPIVTKNYDRKRLTSITSGGLTTSNIYFGNTHLVSRINNIDGTYTEYEYDKLGRLFRKIDKPSNNKDEYEYYFTYFGQSFNSVVHKRILATAVNGRTTFETKQFFNTHGRLIQTLRRELPLYDIVDFIEYDVHGRKVREYMSFTSANSNGNLVLLPPNIKYTEIKYEASPLSRITEVTQPDWYPTKYLYSMNVADDNVKDPQNNYYTVLTPGIYFKETAIDGNGNKIIKFTDRKGRLILSRQTDNADSPSGGKRKDTYTQYDNKNRPIAIIPPGVTNTQTQQIYEYTYDAEDKMTGKKVPSKGWTNYWYNNKDLIAVQKDAKNQYITFQYDNLGRVIKESLSTTLPTNLENPTNTGNLLKEYSYGTSGIDAGKLKIKRTRILGTNKMIKSSSTYDSRGRLYQVTSTNHLNTDDLMSYPITQLISYPDLITNNFDQANDIQSIQVSLTPKISNANYPISFTNTFGYDNMKRVNSQIFSHSFGSFSGSQQISSSDYNFRSQLTQSIQGGNLQTLKYFYKANGLFERLNSESLTGNDLFHYEMYYDAALMGGSAVERKNGDIANIKYKVKNGPTRLNVYNYDEYNQLTASTYYEHNGTSYINNGQYNESFTYSTNGRIISATRNGNQLNTSGNYLIDNLSYIYNSDNIRLERVNDVSPGSNGTQGHNQNNITGIAFLYDANGNVTKDLHRNISSIAYNHLNLPTIISRNDGSKIEMTYDADGNLLTRKTYSGGLSLLETREYVGGVEIANNVVAQINHSQGRLQRHNNIYRHEYTINDHLGNTRIVYTSNGTGGVTVIDENHYYAYGMEYRGFAPLSGTSNYNYKFNGIERVESFNLDFAFYRGLDPVLGLWMQVDPKAESVVGMYPYCAMGNNPISQVDPKGDLPFLAVVGIGFASGVLFNGFNNYDNGENFWSNGFKAGLWSAAGASISFGIGEAFGGLGSTLKEFGRAASHALAQGALAHLQGGNFWQGVSSGGLSSIGGSGLQALGFSDGAMIFGSSALGGLGSKLAGGDFWKGFGIGLTVGVFNHILHNAISEIDPLPDGRSLWELSSEEFAKFANAETRSEVTGCECDITLSLAERMYLLGKLLGLASPTAKLPSIASLTATERARALGKAGEQAVGLSGPKKAIQVGSKTRIPDGLTSTTLTEVKNVKTLSYSSQLRDFVNYSQQNTLSFILYTRSTTIITGPLQQAINNGLIIHKIIP
jgi:RHS repeat-associated protein